MIVVYLFFKVLKQTEKTIDNLYLVFNNYSVVFLMEVILYEKKIVVKTFLV